MDPMPEDWDRAVAVVAHPDDLEYGAAAAVARWTRQGRHVAYVLATAGEAGIEGMAPDVVGPLRQEEERRSAAVVGVSDVDFLGHADGLVEYGVPLRRDIAAAIRRHRPDVVITMSFDLTWGDEGPVNHADHRAVGLATLDAARDADNSWLFPDAGPAWHGVKSIYVAAPPVPRTSWTSPAPSTRAWRPCASTRPTSTASAATSTRTTSCARWPASSAWPRAASTRWACAGTRPDPGPVRRPARCARARRSASA